MFQVFTLMMVLMFGLFLGIDTAEQNIQKIQGSQGAPRAVQITPENGRVEIAVLGHVYEAENPVKKEEEREPKVKKGESSQVSSRSLEESSWMAQVSNQVGQGLRQGTRKALDEVVGWLD
ncbi:DUF3679 domain-containing protein [Marinithermofilum abyssi]|nr:DUF3679 domain-containing protein [Marinithermofilum abyssi]